jgi:hypothetical protein
MSRSPQHNFRVALEDDRIYPLTYAQQAGRLKAWTAASREIGALMPPVPRSEYLVKLTGN